MYFSLYVQAVQEADTPYFKEEETSSFETVLTIAYFLNAPWKIGMETNLPTIKARITAQFSHPLC